MVPPRRWKRLRPAALETERLIYLSEGLKKRSKSSLVLTIFIGEKCVEWGFQRAEAKTISKESGFAYDFHQEGDFRGKWGK